MNGCARVEGFDPSQAKEPLNRWIAHESALATREITEAIETYRFNDAAAAIYRFIWNIYCDWYLELAKPVLTGADGPAKVETQASVAWARDEILKLLHPFMPFITEELWAVTAKRGSLLALAEWPLRKQVSAAAMAQTINAAMAGDPLTMTAMPLQAVFEEQFSDPAAEAEIGWLVDLVTAVRSVRSEMNIPPATLIPLVLAGASSDNRARADRWIDVIKRLARVSELSFADAPPAGAVQLLVRGEVAAIPLKGVIDLAAEKTRLDKELARADGDIKRVDAKLGNADFMARAPEDVVEEQREKRDEAVDRRTKIVEALERLKGVG
jgi:valyl-tRNA synthetase